MALAVYLARAFWAPVDVNPGAAAPHLEAIRAVEGARGAESFGPRLRAAREAVRDGHYLELKRDVRAAHAQYLRARDHVAAVRLALARSDPEAGREADPEAAGRLAGVESFITARLTATAGR